MFEDIKARKALQQVTPSLQALDKQLTEVEQINDPIDRLVRFFDTVARFNDQQQDAPLTVGRVLEAFRKANRGDKHAETIKTLEQLQAHFNNSGRNEYGMNRTRPGEPVTAEKVYLGNIFGRWTFTASAWRDTFSRSTPSAQEDKQIIEGQAAGFVASHAAPMHKLIKTLGSPG